MMAVLTPSLPVVSITCKTIFHLMIIVLSICANMSISSLANGFAYWQDKSIDDSSDTYFYDMSQAMDHIQNIAGDNAKNVRFGNGETGWPTSKMKPE